MNHRTEANPPRARGERGERGPGLERRPLREPGHAGEVILAIDPGEDLLILQLAVEIRETSPDILDTILECCSPWRYDSGDLLLQLLEVCVHVPICDGLRRCGGWRRWRWS